MELCFGQQSPSAVRRQDGEFVLEFPERDELRGDRLLVAIGRRARIHDIGLENVGIEPGRRGIEVDARMRAGDGIWATGDASGVWPLTYVGKYQGPPASSCHGGVRVSREEQGADHRARLGSGLVLVGVGAVKEVFAVHEGGRAATVEIDGFLGAERDHEPGQLAELEPAIDPRAAPVAAHREELGLADPERAARVAANRDVGIELRRARGKALPVFAIHQGAAPGHEQRPGLHQVAGGVAHEPLASRDADAAVNVHASALLTPRWSDGLVLHDIPTYAELSERAPRIA